VDHRDQSIFYFALLFFRFFQLAQQDEFAQQLRGFQTWASSRRQENVINLTASFGCQIHEQADGTHRASPSGRQSADHSFVRDYAIFQVDKSDRQNQFAGRLDARPKSSKNVGGFGPGLNSLEGAFAQNLFGNPENFKNSLKGNFFSLLWDWIEQG
jgi:hypothetical protein